ncbi:MAG: hypothetical protein AAGF47_08090 [Planctomycetota bacterium]
MSWGAFAIALWLAIGLDRGIAAVLGLGGSGVQPSFLLPLIVFIGMYAPARTATAAACIAGLLLDLLSPRSLPGGGLVFVPGPNALGLTLAVQFVLGARGIVLLNSPITIVVLTPVAGAVWHVVATSVLTIREFYDPIGFEALPTLGARVLDALYSAITALVLWFPLFWSAAVFRFDSPHVARWLSRR